MTKKSKNKKSELRDLLKSAGYLDNRLDGFFLRSLKFKGNTALNFLFTSLKIGVAVGFVFAVMFSISIVHFNPRITSSIKDIALLTLYLWLLLSIIMTVLTLVIGILLSLFQKLARGGAKKMNISLLTATLIGLAVFAYNSIWWIKASSSVAASSNGIRDLVAFVIIFALSFGIGRLVFFGGIALMTRNEAEIKIGRMINFKRKHLLILASASILLFALLFFVVGTKIAKPQERESSEYSVVHTDKKILLIAIDGMDYHLTNRLIASGELKTLALMKNKAASGRFEGDHRNIPPVFWTTVATGVNPLEHGIADIRAHRIAGVDTPLQTSFSNTTFGKMFKALVPTSRLTSDVPITANLRRSKTFWNILNDKTYSVGIVNWWVSWPCDEVTGFMASERLIYKLETKGDWEQDLVPREDYEHLAKEYPVWKTEFDKMFTKEFDTLFIDSDISEASLKEAVWIDYFNINVFRYLENAHSAKLAALYLPGLDIVQKKLFEDAPIKNLGSLYKRMEILKAYYRFIDRFLDTLNTEYGDYDYKFIISSSGRTVEGSLVIKGGNDGIFMISGAGIDSTKKNLRLRAEDITPTILYLSGFPQSKDFEGKPMTSILQPRTAANLSLETIETFGDRKAGKTENIESQFSDEVLEQLKNLGYIN